MKPYPHQVAGAAFFQHQDSGLIADEPGLGKTVTVSMIASQAWEPGTSVAVLSPRNVKKHWAKTLEMVNPALASHAKVANYEKLSSFDALSNVSMLIVDESHKLKNEHSSRFLDLYERWKKWSWERSLRAKPLKVFFATGTPVYSYPIDLLTSLILMRKLDPEMAGAFKVRYCGPSKRKIPGQHRKALDLRGATNLGELRELCKPFLLRRTWEEVGIEMPPVTLTDLEVSVKISDPDYFRAKEDFKKFYEEQGGRPGGAGMAKFTVLRRILAHAKAPAAAEQALDDIRGEQKTIVFTEFRDVAKEIQAKIESDGERALLVLGGQSEREREGIIRDFIDGKGAVALVATTDSLGEGTDGLQEACHLVSFVDSDFEDKMFVQALRRVARLRQRHPVAVRRFVVEGDEMERMITENAFKKERIARALGLGSSLSLLSLKD